MLSERDKEAFWARVKKEGDCWLWIGTAKNRGQNPTLTLRCVTYPARRIAHLLVNGEPPKEGKNLKPECGHKLCVNPSHLRYGKERLSL